MSEKLRMSRRQVLKTGATGLLMPTLGGCSFWRDTPVACPQLPAKRRGIDTHCHVFNVSDLPAEEFVHRVIFGEYEDTIVLPTEATESFVSTIAQFLVRILRQGAIEAWREADAIEHGDPIEAFEGPSRSDREILRRVLSETSGDDGGLPLPPPVDGSGGTSMDQPGETGTSGGEESGAGATDDPVVRGIVDALKQEGLLGSEEAFIIDDIIEAILKSTQAIGRNVRWALTMLRPRQQIVDKLVTLYGGDGGIDLFTAALVDFDYWLNEFPPSPFADQIRVMDLIQRRQTGHSMVHCFAPFDPLAQYIAVRDGMPDNKTPLGLVKHAVMDCGFVGVKLYPPMGFVPYGNERHKVAVPERFAGDNQFYRGLDDALKALYAWASDNQVAVMAHATDSNAAVLGSGERASPSFWEPALRDYPDMRVNLGHFGDFEEITRRNGNVAGDAWENRIGTMVREGHDTLFSDISYFSEILCGKATEASRNELLGHFRAYIHDYDNDLKSLIYGSDWIMVGRELGHERYISALTGFLQDAGADAQQIDRVFWDNPVRFLGLQPGRPARRRLEDYYTKHGLDRDRLKRFDTTPA